MDNLNSKYKYYKLISSEHKWFDLKFREVWKYRDLILLFTKRDFIVKYKQTLLGPVWCIIKPFFTSFLYVIVFSNIAKISTDGVPQMLFYLSGNAFWSFFAGCLNKNSGTFRGNSGLFGKIYFPRLTVSISYILSSFIDFLIQIALTFLLIVYYCFKGTIHPAFQYWIVIPVIMVDVGLLGMGFGIIISSLTTKYRDLSILVDFGVSLWMYATPVIYPLSTISEGRLKTLILINPITSQIELFRAILLGHGSVNAAGLIYDVILTAIIVLIGSVVFNKVERNFMDTI